MLTDNRQEAKECAIQDIQKELSRQNKDFVGFIHSLDPVMEELVSIYEDQQEIISSPKSYCGLYISTSK